MKQVIRKWLGIENISDETIETIESTINTMVNDEIRQRVKGAIVDAFDPVDKQPASTIQGMVWSLSEKDHLNKLLAKTIDKKLSTETTIKVKLTMDNIIGRERFIDDVVQRINVKQLT